MDKNSRFFRSNYHFALQQEYPKTFEQFQLLHAQSERARYLHQAKRIFLMCHYSQKEYIYLTKDDISNFFHRYLLSEKSNGEFTTATYRSYYYRLLDFMRFALDDKEKATQLFSDVKSREITCTPYPTTIIPNDAEVHIFLEALKPHDHLFLIANFLLYTGLTVKEILAIKTEHIYKDAEDRFCLRVQKAKSNVRIIVLAPHLQTLLERHMQLYARYLFEYKVLFFNTRNKPLTKTTLYRHMDPIISKLYQDKKISQLFNLQDLKNYYIYNGINKGDIAAIAEYSDLSFKYLQQRKGKYIKPIEYPF